MLCVGYLFDGACQAGALRKEWRRGSRVTRRNDRYWVRGQASRASLASAVDRQKRALDTVSAPRVADGGLGWQVAFLPGRKTTVQAHPRGWKEHASHLRKRANSLDAHA